MTITLEICISDPLFVKEKIVLKAEVYFDFSTVCLQFLVVCLKFFKIKFSPKRTLALPTWGQKCMNIFRAIAI